MRRNLTFKDQIRKKKFYIAREFVDELENRLLSEGLIVDVR